MGLFGRKGEQKRDYQALIGAGGADDVLQLTPKMQAPVQAPLALKSKQITKYTDTEMKSVRSDLQAKIECQDGELKSSREQLRGLNDELAAIKTAENINSKNSKIELQALGTECDNLKNKVRSGRRTIKERNRELCERQDELAQLQSSTMARIADYKSELFEKSRKLDKQRGKIRALKAELSDVRDGLATSEFKLSDLQDQMAIRSLGNTGQSEKVKKLTGKNEQLVGTIARLKEKIGETHARLDSVLAENQEIKTELEAVRTRKLELEDREDIVKETLRNARDKLVEMRKREEEALAENAIVVAQNRALIARQEELLAEIQFVQTDRSKMKSDDLLESRFMKIAFS